MNNQSRKTLLNITELTIRQLAGQRLMVGFEGTQLNADLKFLIATLNIGGIILFTGNIENPNQLKTLCTSIQDYALSQNQLPLFIAIDQEGGQVARLKAPFTIFPGNSEMKNRSDAKQFAEITASELKNIGINMNMAPVLDVTPRDIQSIMKKRSFGSDPKEVAEMGGTVIQHLQKRGTMAVAKHFPGIGRTVIDSHLELPELDIDLPLLESSDLIPFKEAISHDVSGMMLSHILYKHVDPIWPASLSPIIAGGLLRKQLGFENIIMTDDLDMDAIKNHFNIETAVKQILSAEIDIALICHKGPDIEIAYLEILNSITSSRDMKDKCLSSVERILRLKEKYLMD